MTSEQTKNIIMPSLQTRSRLRVFDPASPSRQGTQAADPMQAPVVFLHSAMARKGLNEIYGATVADTAAVAGFTLAHVSRLLGKKSRGGRGPSILWARHELLPHEAGGIYPPGLMEFGITPSTVTVVRVPDVTSVLQAGLDAARCAALSAILIEFWGSARAYDLTASRKLALAAKNSGVALFLLRHGATPLASAADTRWSVRGLASRPFAANAPGRPAFGIALLRHRGGAAGQTWSVEWNRDTACFETPGAFEKTEQRVGQTRPELNPAPLSGDLAAAAGHRKIAFRKTA